MSVTRTEIPKSRGVFSTVSSTARSKLSSDRLRRVIGASATATVPFIDLTVDEDGADSTAGLLTQPLLRSHSRNRAKGVLALFTITRAGSTPKKVHGALLSLQYDRVEASEENME